MYTSSTLRRRTASCAHWCAASGSAGHLHAHGCPATSAHRRTAALRWRCVLLRRGVLLWWCVLLLLLRCSTSLWSSYVT